MAPPANPVPDGHNPHKVKVNLKLTTIDTIGGIFCSICKVTFRNKKEYDDHYKKHNNSNSEITYTCVVCHREILGYASFRGHCYTAHIIKERFKCNICSKNFSKQSALKIHNEAMHMFKCRAPCNKEFTSKQEFQLHQVIHKESSSNGPPYPCKKCQAKIVTLDTCEQHLDKHVLYTYSCPICEKKFNDRPTIAQHLTTHFKGETFQYIESTKTEEADNAAITALGGIYCNICDDTYKNKMDFDNHFQSDHPEEDVEYMCNKCGDDFEEYTQLANHCYNHYVQGKFICGHCSRSFKRNSLLVAHVCSGSRVQSADIGFTCGDGCCGETFKSTKDLIIHQNRIRQIESYCRQCGMEFDSLASCDKHLELHKQKSFTCPVCDRKINERYHSNIHLRSHFQSVLHICKICGKIYKAHYRLQQHLKVHSVGNKMECEVCGKGFDDLERYQQHLRTHTGERPFKCVACDKSFVSRPNWYKHVRRMHHDIDPKSLKGVEVQKIHNRQLSPENEEYPTKDDEMPPENQTDEELSNETPVDSILFEKSDSDVDSLKTRNRAIDINPGILEEVTSLASLEPSSEAEDTVLGSIEPSIGNDTDLESIDPSIVDDETDLTFSEDLSRATSSSSLDTPRMFYTNSGVSGSSSHQSTDVPDYPREYGPEFINQGLNTTPHTGHIINLDDHILAHIDPLLTIQPTVQQTAPNHPTAFYEHPTAYYEHPTETASLTEKWEPPIITKILESYSFDQMTDISANILSMMKTEFY